MAHLELVDSDDLKQKNKIFHDRHRLFSLHLARILFFTVLNLFTYLLDYSHRQFINPDFSVYSMLSMSGVFLTSSILFIFWNELGDNKKSNLGVLIFDVLFVYLFIQYSGLAATQFVFLYLAVIIFSGLILTKSESLLIACLACLFFNINLVSTSFSETSQVFTFLLNNISFLLTSYLAGSLGSHLTEVGVELKKKESEIDYVKNINSLIVDNISSGIISVDKMGTVFSINQSAIDIIGQDITDKKINSVFSFDAEVQSSKGRLETTVRVGEEKKILEVIHSPLVDDEGGDKGNLYLIQDLTKMKKLEYAVRQQDKLAAVGQLAAGIAHEIRNPLASISGSVQLLETSAKDPENIQLFKIILREIDRLNDLITEFLEFVRPDNVNEEPMSVNHLVEDMMGLVKMNKTIRQDVTVDLSLLAKRTIHGDAPKLKQALLNIILNSYQAMTEVEGPKLSIRTYDENDKVVLVLTDTGIGIKPETLDKIFEPFHTTKFKGTGLGLAITHKILENHKAEVYVDSELGAGTQFSISFPAKGDWFPKEDKIRRIA